MKAILALRDKYETNPERRISHDQWAAAHPEEAAALLKKNDAMRAEAREAALGAEKKDS
jgi:hypothetical protein